MRQGFLRPLRSVFAASGSFFSGVRGFCRVFPASLSCFLVGFFGGIFPSIRLVPLAGYTPMPRVLYIGRILASGSCSPNAGLPGYVTDSLHDLRTIGNMAAHPNKSTATGDYLEVEPGEAEWTLDTLDALFSHLFIEPAKTAARKAALAARTGA